MGWVSTDKFNRILTSEKKFLRENKITFFFKAFGIFFVRYFSLMPRILYHFLSNQEEETVGGAEVVLAAATWPQLSSISSGGWKWRGAPLRDLPVRQALGIHVSGLVATFFFFFLIKRLFKNVRSLQVSKSFPFAKVACVCQLFADALIFSLRKECSWGGSSNTRVQK